MKPLRLRDCLLAALLALALAGGTAAALGLGPAVANVLFAAAFVGCWVALHARP